MRESGVEPTVAAEHIVITSQPLHAGQIDNRHAHECNVHVPPAPRGRLLNTARQAPEITRVFGAAESYVDAVGEIQSGGRGRALAPGPWCVAWQRQVCIRTFEQRVGSGKN